MAVVAYAEIWTLRLGGIFPSWRTCIECGSPLTRPLRFDARLQGFVCGDCAGRDAFVISNDAAEALDAIGRSPASEFNAPLDVLMEVRSLAGTVRRNFLGHELKSFEVLASLSNR